MILCQYNVSGIESINWGIATALGQSTLYRIVHKTVINSTLDTMLQSEKINYWTMLRLDSISISLEWLFPCLSPLLSHSPFNHSDTELSRNIGKCMKQDNYADLLPAAGGRICWAEGTGWTGVVGHVQSYQHANIVWRQATVDGPWVKLCVCVCVYYLIYII